MEIPIIPIPRASESWINGFIKMKILEVTEFGLVVREERGESDGKQGKSNGE